MKSLRLNKQMRQDILQSFVDKYVQANPAPEVSLQEWELKSNLAKALHQRVYGKILEKVKDVPKEFLRTSYGIKVQWTNDSISYLYFKDENDNSVYLLSTGESKVEYVIKGDEPEYVTYKAATDGRKQQEATYNEWNKALTKFKSEVTQVLESVNTTGQLVEVWPEAAPFVPAEIADPSKINLPAVNFAELNKVIG